MSKVTTVDMLEVHPGFGVGVRLAIIISDEGEELGRKYHRTLIPFNYPVEVPDAVAFQMAEVGVHLAEMGYPQLDPADIDRIKEFYNLGKK